MELGVCYYPEQWPQGQWADDAKAMVAAGLGHVRIGEFAWSAYEPQRGEFQWEWLDRALESLGAAGLDVVLGTPTAAPPVWLAQERPEILAVGADGRRRPWGSRRHTCPTSAAYREESRRIVAALVDRYGAHPAVTGWQVDNEPGSHDSARCWCEECQAAFVHWLADRYGTVERLNQAWGTVFWSGTYPSFEAVRLPRSTTAPHSPSLLLAHRRFSSQQAISFIAAQYPLIRQGAPGRDVTTNLHLGELHVDARPVARLGGIAAVGNYPHATSGGAETPFLLDLAAGLAGPQGRMWVMEQQSGPIHWSDTNPFVPPGQLRVWAWQAAMHGAERVLFFRWRAARHGQEQYHSGLLRHDGSVDRGLVEVEELAAGLATAGPGVLAPAARRVALLHAYDDAWALEIDPHGSGLSHRSLQLAAYQAARRLGEEVAIVEAGADLTAFEVVLAPGLHLSTPARLEALATALDAGAVVILGPRSLVKDEDNAWCADALPAGMSRRLGARVGEFGNAAPNTTVAEYAVAAGPWVEVLEVDGAEVLARYGGGTHLDGGPAAVRRNGLVYAGFSSAAAWTALLAAVLEQPAQPPHLERFRRPGGVVEIDHHRLAVTLTS